MTNSKVNADNKWMLKFSIYKLPILGEVQLFPPPRYDGTADRWKRFPIFDLIDIVKQTTQNDQTWSNKSK